MRKTYNKTNNSTVKILKLTLYNFAIEAFIFVSLCLVMLLSNLNLSLIYPLTISGLCLGNFISGYINGKSIKQHGLINGLIYTLPSTSLILLISLYINDFSVGYRVILSTVLLCVFSAFGGILSVNTGKKVRIKR